MFQLVEDWKELKESGVTFSHEEIYNEALFTVPTDTPKGAYRVIYYYEKDSATQCQADLTVK